MPTDRIDARAIDTAPTLVRRGPTLTGMPADTIGDPVPIVT
ncbi:MAG: hypothetical protein ACJAXA_003124 [Candidatus Aldehydirespiratoraceae bacterium]